jgi:NNP family nitrate/nitrite transporter-like MFS transporter
MRRTAQLALATMSFAVCFAAWGLIGAFAPQFRGMYRLSGFQTSLLVAVPVLLGSVARLPMGVLTDRWGGRIVLPALAALVAVPLYLIPSVHSFQTLLAMAFCLGLAGSSFAVGVGFIAPWFPANRQGSALGVYGLGNAGQSIAVFLGPLLAISIGWPAVFKGAAAALVIWAAIFLVFARNAPHSRPPARWQHAMAVLARSPLSWALAAFYFLTFGGFVAFSIYLPTLLKDQFGLSPADAGLRTAGFVLLATGTRPLGGWLADRIGGARVLNGVFLGVIPFALLLSWPAMIPFTAGALGCAALLGFGNGAVFKLVPEYFAAETGTVTGLVGAMGGLGGFFPPLLLGLFRDALGTVWPAYVSLAVTALVLHRLNAKTFMARQQALEQTRPAALQRANDRLRSGAWATIGTGLLVAMIVVGSRNLQYFDAALVVYTFAVVFATWGVLYHYNVWLQKPPTRVYWQRGWELFRREGLLRGPMRLAALTGRQVLAQRFIAKRSTLRWYTHQLLFWGCMLAAAITFPLVFGWISFRTPVDQMTYVVYLFGFPTGSFRLGTIVAELLFHGLDVSALLVLAGIALVLWRRLREKGAQATQSFAFDFVPLLMLVAISITGLALTASQWWFEGQFYSFLAILHAITVIGALLYMPFGKFFHIFQRPAQLGVKFYQRAGEHGAGVACARCGQRFSSAMHLSDIEKVLPQLGFDYRMSGPVRTWQHLCPACKRISLSRAQLRLKAQ